MYLLVKLKASTSTNIKILYRLKAVLISYVERLVKKRIRNNEEEVITD